MAAKRAENSLPKNLESKQFNGSSLLKKPCKNRRKFWKLALSPFPARLFTNSETITIISVKSNMSSTSAIMLDKSKILSIGKDLIYS